VGERCLWKDFGKIHRRAVKLVYTTADSKMLISADLGGNINVFSIELGSLAKYFPRAHDSAITSIVATPKGDIYASGDIGGS
jgi:WD40 repeat protein